MSERPNSQPPVSTGWIVAVIVTFMLSIVAAGHGVAPVGLLLLVGWQAWLPQVLLGWLAVIVLGSSTLVRTTSRVGLAKFGSVLVFLAWAFFQTQSEAFVLTLLYSFPLFGCLGGLALRLWSA
jgi:hypothetical protein